MTTIEQIDQALRDKGWRYDRGEEVFRDGDRDVEWKDVIGLVSGLTPDDQYDKCVSAKSPN